MRNELFNKEDIYNKDLKEQFISRYPESAHNVYRRVFYYSAPIEEVYCTDLYEFNLKQVGEVLRSMNPSSIASVKSAISVMRAYIDWAIHRRPNNINPLDSTDIEWERQFVDKTKKLFFSHEEIYEVIAACKNRQDSIIPALLFEGANGKEVSELRNLRMSDILDKDNGIIRLTNDKGETREIKVSNECIQLIIGAASETEYFKRNGEISPTSRNIKQTSDLIETGFVIKPANTKNVHMDQVNPHVLYGRLSTISEMLDIPNFTVKNLQRSGMIYMAKQIYDRDGKFGDKEQFYEICEKFGVPKYDNHGYEAYNYYGMKEYVNEDMIEQLYESSLS